VDCLRVLHSAGASMDEQFDSNVWPPLPDGMIECFACGDDDERLHNGIKLNSTYDADVLLAGVISADSDVRVCA